MVEFDEEVLVEVAEDGAGRHALGYGWGTDVEEDVHGEGRKRFDGI